MKKQSTKKVLALATSAAMMLTAFTACGSSQAPSTTPTQQTSEAQSEEAKDDSTNGDTVTINFWHHYSAQSAENETLMNVLIPRRRLNIDIIFDVYISTANLQLIFDICK